jgi:hypothetical protein
VNELPLRPLAALAALDLVLLAIYLLASRAALAAV